MAVSRKKVVVSGRTSSYCISHKVSLPSEDFYKSANPLHDGFTPYCKRCTQKIYDDYFKRFKDIETALWYTCSELGVPFIRSVYEQLLGRIKGVKNPSFIGIYMALLNSQRRSTVKWDTFADTDVPLGEINNLQDIELSRQEQIHELKMTWGDDLEIDDITFLEWRFTTYTKDMELTEYQASRYRDLCSCELKIKKDIDTQQNIKLKAMIAKELGIDQFTVNKEKTDVEKLLENDIFMMEKYEPAEYYADKDLYSDFVGIHKYWIKWVLRPIKNLVIGSKDYEIKEDSKYGEGDRDE